VATGGLPEGAQTPGSYLVPSLNHTLQKRGANSHLNCSNTTEPLFHHRVITSLMQLLFSTSYSFLGKGKRKFSMHFLFFIY